MFHLLKILNGRTGTPEPTRISLTADASVKYGMPVCISAGVLTKMSPTSTTLPTHLILADSEGSEVLASPICEEMIFEVPLSAAPTSLVEGKEYLIGADGMTLSATVADGTKRGALLLFKGGAGKIGDTVTVCFGN